MIKSIYTFLYYYSSAGFNWLDFRFTSLPFIHLEMWICLNPESKLVTMATKYNRALNVIKSSEVLLKVLKLVQSLRVSKIQFLDQCRWTLLEWNLIYNVLWSERCLLKIVTALIEYSIFQFRYILRLFYFFKPLGKCIIKKFWNPAASNAITTDNEYKLEEK